MSGLDDLGRGRRFRKVHWEEGSFWHIVDAKIAEQSGKEGAESAEIRLKRVSGVKFRDNVPQTGRVTRIRDAQKHMWLPIEKS
jgi:hypothetical protein